MADGYNITALIAGFFVTHLTFLVEAGLVYVLKCPLFEQNGKYYYDKDEPGFDENKPYNRFKGLGSMDPDQVADFILNPKVRHLERITMKDVGDARWILTSRQGRRDLLEDISVIDPDTRITSKDIDMNKVVEVVE